MDASAFSRPARAERQPPELRRRHSLPPASAPSSNDRSGDERASACDPRVALAPIKCTINRLNRIRRRHGFGLDELVILAACGAINLAGSRQDLPFAQPANIASIADYIRVPRETVRRKLQVIEAKGFVARYSGGYLVTDFNEWLALVGFLGADARGERASV
jgi:hypothetical protein